MRSFIKTGLGPVQIGPDHPSQSGLVIDINQDWPAWSCLQDLTGRTIRNPGYFCYRYFRVRKVITVAGAASSVSNSPIIGASRSYDRSQDMNVYSTPIIPPPLLTCIPSGPSAPKFVGSKDTLQIFPVLQ